MLGIYARLSREDVDAKSIENQVNSGKDFANSMNLAFEVYVDEGISGTLPIDKRPSFNKLINDILEGSITSLFVTNQDRLERNTEVWFHITKLFKEADIKLYLEGGKSFNFDNADELFMSNISSLFNQRYVEIFKRKIRKVLDRNVKEGKVHGLLAYGFTKDSNGYQIIDNEESEVIKEIYALSLSGIGTDSIANILNEKNILTRYQKIGKGTYKVKDKFNDTYKTLEKSQAQWKGNTIRTILRNPLYKGVRVWKNQEFEVPQILSADYWQKVNDNIIKNANNSGKKIVHKYLLRGVLKCNKCGRNMYGRSRSNKRDHYYQCSSKRNKNQSCGNRSINIDKIEGVIWSRFFRDDELMRLIEKEIVKDENIVTEIGAKIDIRSKSNKDLMRRKNNLIDAISDGTLSHEDAKSKLDAIKNEIVQNNRLINDYQIQLRNAKDSQKIIEEREVEFKTYTDKLSFLEKQAVVKKYIKEIYVHNWDNKTSIYSLILKFNINLIDEHYVFDTRGGILVSLNDEKFYLSKFFSENIEDSSIVQNKGILDNFFITPSGKILSKPFYIDNNNQAFFLQNTIIPHGNCSDWNESKLLNFYKKNPTWISKECGLCVMSIDKQKKDYIDKLNGFKNHFSKNGTTEDWILFFLELSSLSELFQD